MNELDILGNLDLSALKPASDGSQSNPGSPGPAGYRVKRVIPVVIVERIGHEDEGEEALSPIELSQGRFSAHPKFLLCGRVNGVFYVADTEDIQEEAVRIANQAAQGFLTQAIGFITSQLASQGVQQVPGLVAGFLGRLLGLAAK